MAIEPMRRTLAGELAREMVPLRTMMDRLLETAFTPAFWSDFRRVAGEWAMDTDVYEDDDNFYIRCYLPGIDPNAVNISALGNVLTISGEVTRKTPEHWRPVFQEMTTGRFERRITLDTPVDAGKASATYRDGILEITLPKAEAHKPRTIKVQAAKA
jgi:HSP20 family protein